MPASKHTGARGEAIARRYLRQRGFRIIECNWSSIFGELDIVAEKAGVLTFVEVKTRRADNTEAALEGITAAKRERMLKAVYQYLHDRETSIRTSNGGSMSSLLRCRAKDRQSWITWRTPLIGDQMPLVIVLGPTGVGKTSLAIQLAGALAGEIVGADSRQIYRHMDIGTAKPSAAQQAQVPHHLIDIVDPDYNLSLAEYQDAAYRCINELHQRGALPFLVGGSGQYISAVEEGWSIPRVAPNPDIRADLEAYVAATIRRRRCTTACAKWTRYPPTAFTPTISAA